MTRRSTHSGKCHVPNCPVVWRCRNCGQRFCEHHCSYKDAHGGAMCGKCQRIIAHNFGKKVKRGT